MDVKKNLPSEKVQKEYELNPLKILETIRNEKEEKVAQKEISEDRTNEKKNINNIIKDKNLYSEKGFKKPNTNNDINTSIDFRQNTKQNQLDEIRNNINNNLNSIINNINTNNNNNITYHNNLVNYNSNINFNNKNNIIVNHLNIFFNFNNNNEDLPVSKDRSQNYKIFCNNNKKFCNDNNNINFVKNNEIINNNINNINIDKLLSNLKTYKGSIISQALMDNIDDKEELSIFFNSIIPYICQIMCLEYGNYFFQKLIKKLDIQQRLNIYQIIDPEFLVIATNKCGTHSIQSLMDVIQTSYELFALNKLISKNMLLLFTDDNAYHIMMKMILDFPEENRNLLNIYLVMNIEKIIINVNGAFCVNKFITNNKNLKLRSLLVENLRNNIRKLVFNKFSCINLLLVLQTFGLEWGSFVIKEIETNFIVLSENPISNVFISKVLEYLKNNNMTILKLLIWSLYKNIVLINYLISNKNHKKLLNQIIEYSDNEQKNYLLIMLKNSSW